MEQFLRIGVITTSHGLKGEVKVYPTTDSPQRFREVKRVLIKTPKDTIETEITDARFFKNLAIVKFAAFDDVEQVKNLHNAEIYICREDGQKLEEGEYYIADLIGCRVITTDGQTLGTVKDVLQTGANDVYVVDTAGAEVQGLSGNNNELLLPVIPDCIRNVDIEKEEITVFLMPGLV